MEMGNAVFALIIVLLLLAGSIWLQIFLSTKNNKWLGLIIPLICLIIAVSGVLGLTMYTTSSGITTVTETVNGDVIREEPIAVESEEPSILSMLVTVIPTFLMFNIPTFVFLAIYFACREKLKTKKLLDRMNVQDLE